MRVLLGLLAVCVAALTIAVPARAALPNPPTGGPPETLRVHGPAYDQTVAGLLTYAAGHWGGVPVACTDGVFVTTRELAAGYNLTPGAAAAWATLGGCTVIVETVDPYLWPITDTNRRVWCRIMIHEYGHLLGYEHTSDPADIMHATTPVNGSFGPCDHIPTAPSFVEPPAGDAVGREVTGPVTMEIFLPEPVRSCPAGQTRTRGDCRSFERRPARCESQACRRNAAAARREFGFENGRRAGPGFENRGHRDRSTLRKPR